MDELLKTVDAIVSYMGAAGEIYPQGGYVAVPQRLTWQLATAYKALPEKVKCLCGGKHP